MEGYRDISRRPTSRTEEGDSALAPSHVDLVVGERRCCISDERRQEYEGDDCVVDVVEGLNIGNDSLSRLLAI